jgi:bacillithiol system protein YtxJ
MAASLWFNLLGMSFSSSTETTPKIPELRSNAEFDALLAEELVIIFKHSNACDRSWGAHDEIMEFRRDQPNVPLYLVSVLDSRPASQHIAHVSGVEHQSPQVLVFRRGKVVGFASHLGVTAERVKTIIENS